MVCPSGEIEGYLNHRGFSWAETVIGRKSRKLHTKNVDILVMILNFRIYINNTNIVKSIQPNKLSENKLSLVD